MAGKGFGSEAGGRIVTKDKLKLLSSAKDQREAGNHDSGRRSAGHRDQLVRYARLVYQVDGVTCDVVAIRVDQRHDLDNAIRSALGHRGPSIVHIDTDPLLV